MRGKSQPDQLQLYNSYRTIPNWSPPMVTIISISNLQADWNPFSQGTKTPQLPPAPHILPTEAMPNNFRSSAEIRPLCHLLQLRPRYFPTELPMMYMASSRGGFGDPGSTEVPDQIILCRHTESMTASRIKQHEWISFSLGRRPDHFSSLRVCSRLVLDYRSRDNCSTCFDSDFSPVGHWIQLLRHGVLRWVSEN